jgi:multimeric flavodoxin WrbA
VYNGNPEPDMIEFSESVLNAGKNPNHLDMSNRFVGAFCTSAGYTTGAQPVLNALARIFMTFGASYIGGRYENRQRMGLGSKYEGFTKTGD